MKNQYSTLPSISRAEGIAIGKTMRETVPRSCHEQWEPAPDRSDPIALLQTSNAGRLPELIPLRYKRMLASPFAFLRGSAIVMAADLHHTPKTGITVQACGDCHLSNFGAYGTPERHMVFDLNDFDETLPAPWEWDVKRLATSIVVASRSLKFADKIGRLAAITAVQSYREQMHEYAKMSPMSVWYDHIGVESLLTFTDHAKEQKKLKSEVKKAQAFTPELELHKLTEVVQGEHRLVDHPPLVFHSAPEDPLSQEMRSVFHQYRQTLREDCRLLLDHYQIVDIAMKVVGIGSVGTRCGVALLVTGDHDPLFLQIKQATASVLEPYAGKSYYTNHAQRVVAGQHLIQAASDPFLGWTKHDRSQGSSGHDFYLRQLRDMKLSVEIDEMSAIDLRGYAHLCGWALARSHARSGNRFMISGYLGQKVTFDQAIGDFAMAYANQTELDYQALCTAVKSGQIKVDESLLVAA
jgi:uncharacterized protein (DUF2252 family)